jgi:hypothetical protein
MLYSTFEGNSTLGNTAVNANSIGYKGDLPEVFVISNILMGAGDGIYDESIAKYTPEPNDLP